MSKGSNRRPTFIDEEAEDAAWARTFGEKPVMCPPCPQCGERVTDVHLGVHRIPEGRTPDFRECRVCGWNSGVTWTPCDEPLVFVFDRMAVIESREDMRRRLGREPVLCNGAGRS